MTVASAYQLMTVACVLHACVSACESEYNLPVCWEESHQLKIEWHNSPSMTKTAKNMTFIFSWFAETNVEVINTKSDKGKKNRNDFKQITIHH